MKYYVNYEPETGSILGFYIKEVQGGDIPEPNIEITEDEWNTAMVKTCVIRDGKLQEYIPTEENTEREEEINVQSGLTVKDVSGDWPLNRVSGKLSAEHLDYINSGKLGNMLIQAGETDMYVTVSSSGGIKSASGIVSVQLPTPYAIGNDGYGTFPRYYIYANIVSSRAFDFVLNVNNADMVKKTANQFTLDVSGSSTVGSRADGVHKVKIIWLAVGAAE